MLSLFPLCLLVALSACDGDETATPEPVQEVQQPILEDPSKTDTPEVQKRTPAEEAVALADAGRHGEAVAALEALLEANAAEPEFWRLLGQEARLSGEPGALLDRLDADAAIGGQTAAHHALRATLALAADRPADALEAARKLRAANDEEGAALWVTAWEALAPDARPELDPTSLDSTQAGDALLLAATGSKSKRKPLLAELQLTHWRAVLLRARLLEEVGDKEAVGAAWAALLDDTNPDVRRAAALYAAAAADSAAVAAGHAATAARAATEAHDGAAAGEDLATAVDRYLSALRSDEALALATELHAPREAAKDTAGSSWTGLALARAALADGSLQLALTHGRQASTAFAEAGATDEAAAAAWIQGLAAWHLGLTEELKDAASRAGGQAAVLEALSAVLLGQADEALSTLSTATAEGPAGVQLRLAAARTATYAGGNAVSLAGQAVRLADKTGHLPSRIEARLALETYATQAGDSRSAATARADLGRIAAELEAGEALASEVAARNLRAGTAGRFPAEGAPASAAAWTALAGGEVPPAAEGENPIFAWARARAASKAADHTAAFEAYRTAVAASPRHLQGPWTPVSILDGGAGPGVERDLVALHGRSELLSGLAALAIHDDWRSRSDIHTAFAIGDDPSLALDTDTRMALNEAHRRHQVQTLRWFAGAAPAPEATATALAEAETKALETKGYQRALPLPPADYKLIQESLRHMAILSYRLGGQVGDAVVVTATGARVVKLRELKNIRKSSAQLRANLTAGTATGGTATSPVPGDQLRRLLVDIFHEDLLGIGRYLVLPDGPMWGYSFNVLPEQSKGLRFLADIRSIGNASTVAQAFREQARPPLNYNPDFLGLAPFRPPNPADMPASRTLPSEVKIAGRLFGSGMHVIEEDTKATATLFREKASTARFVHVADVHVGTGGSLAFADESVPLAELRGMDLVAQIAVLSGNSSPEVMRRRAQALSSAGARATVVTSWLVPESVRGKYLYTFYEAGNRDRPPARAMVEAREAIQKNPETPNFDPSYWGQFVLYGSP